MIGHYHKFIPNFAALAVPLIDVTRKGASNQLRWDEARDKAFETLKAYIACPPVLRLSDFLKEFVLQTDACNCVGGILLQEEAGVKHPVAFASKKLLPRERNYSTIEECLAIVWAVE